MPKLKLSQSVKILIADPQNHTRNLVADVLRAARYLNITHARDGNQLLANTIEFQPNIVITTSRLPNLSGLEFTRLIRKGHGDVSRLLSIIVMTDTPNAEFLKAARDSGVDEMLVRPFSADALIARIEAVQLRPRQFVESAVYVGPCRRRRMLEDYKGAKRRFLDPSEEHEELMPWETEPAREVVRKSIKKISESAVGLSAGDRKKLRELYNATLETKDHADSTRDENMAAASRSLLRYVMAIGGSGTPDLEVIHTHIGAMHQLSTLGGNDHEERDKLVEGLKKVVDKRLRIAGEASVTNAA